MITYHHIGGRNGTFPLPLKDSVLLNDFHLILYDADTNCFDQMKSADQGKWGKISVHPFCIGGKTGKSLFHLNFHPTTNSLYYFNEQYNDYTLVTHAKYGEYVFGDACRHMSSIELDLSTLDDALRAVGVSAIDYLSLDVQGAEYDILAGSEQLIQDHCIAIQLEVEFVKLYRHQKTFSEINAYMESLDFELLDLGSFGRCAPMSLPIGFRGSEQPLYAEAVYIKKTEALIKKQDVDVLYKAALFALIYSKLGLCLKLLNAIQAIEPIQNKEDSLNYVKCLNEVWALFEESKHIKLPRLSQLFSNERFQDYYALSKDRGHDVHTHQTINQMKQFLPEVKELNKAPRSGLEALLQQYELFDVAEVIKQKRMIESDCFLELTAD